MKDIELLDIYNLDYLKNEKIIIYGAGKYGDYLCSLLELKGLGQNIVCFAVSDCKGNPAVFHKKPVKSIEEFQEELKASIVIAAIGMTHIDEVIERLENYSIKGTYHVSNEVMEDVTKEIIVESRKLPIERNKVFFSNYDGKGYGGNCKYIAEEIMRGQYPMKLIWAVSDKNIQGIPTQIERVQIGTPQYYRELFTSGIYVTNTVHGFYEKKRAGQFFINTWHGYGPFKLAEGAVNKDAASRERYTKSNAASDLFLTASRFYTQIYRDSFFYEGEVMECGAPRNDVFFKDSNAIKASVYEKLAISFNKKIVLYAPTFREDTANSFQKYDVNMKRILNALEQRFGGEYILLYRFHHYLYALGMPQNYYADAIDVTYYPDIQELLVAADVVITDYSSLMWDFSLQRRPVFLYQNDEKDYENDRGFYSPVSEWPYPKAHTQDELVDTIMHFDNDEYINKLNAFFEKYGSCDDGHAAERVVKRIMNEIHKDVQAEFSMEIQYCEDMTSIYEYKKNCPDLYWFLEHFLYKDDEVLYFVDNGKLKAVVSIGDLFRCLEGRKEVILNTSFMWVREKENEKAITFFLEHPTVHELPVIDSSGKFVGVVRSGKQNSKKTWISFRMYAKSLYYGEEAFYLKMAEKFMRHFKGTVLLADLPNDDLAVKYLKSDKEKEDYEKKSEIKPLMQLKEMTDHEERMYWGDVVYEPGISKRFVEEFSEMKITDKNGIKYYENNKTSHYITFENGKRKVPNKNSNAKRKIYLVGPCTIFGAYVADNQTIEYYLQQFMNNNAYEWQVVNFGALNLGYEFQYLLTETLDSADIVLIAFSDRKWTLSIMERCQSVHYIGDFSDIFENIRNPASYILDSFRHINYKISERIAERIYASVEPYFGQKGSIKAENSIRNPIQNYFISWDIYVYYRDFALKYSIESLEGEVGAIVMNCNPFTKGHRYLVEYAAARTDELIIFVVEEDSSVFSFADRIEMVRRGTRDINNIIVVPSGKYNISKSTFAQYFEKDKTIDQINSMEYDVRIFCEVIAECMNISCRFVGEEPTDLVTRQYNETMKEILPQYGIKLDEIPRLKKGEGLISASKVRECITRGDWQGASDYLPETTINYLKNTIFDGNTEGKQT